MYFGCLLGRVLTLSPLLAILFTSPVQAKQEDVAPIDRYVIQQLAPSNASDAATLSIVLYQRLGEVAGILDQISQSSRGQLSDSQRMLLEGALNELSGVRTEMRAQFEKNRTMSVGAGGAQKLKAWEQQTSSLNRTFESIYQNIQAIIGATNPTQQKSALAKARTEVGRLLESARERNSAVLVGKAAIVEQGMGAAQKPEVIRDRSPAPAPEYLSYQNKE